MDNFVADQLAQFNEARESLKQGYISAGLELADENDKELFFQFSERSNTSIKICQEEIEDFANFQRTRSEFETSPVECSLCSRSYREQSVGFLDSDRRRFFPMRDRKYVFGEAQEQEVYVEVGEATNHFVNFFRFDENYQQICIDRLQRRRINGRGNEIYSRMSELIFRPMTVRVYNLNSPSIDVAIKRSNIIIDGCFFELSYLNNLTLTLEAEWPRRQPRVKPFLFGEKIGGSQLPLPKVEFNSDLIRFYQRGMSTEDPVNQFLSFYQVLEYFFVTASDEQLYDKLSRKINDPRFTTSNNNLDKIIQDTLNHKGETDETEMLKLVLNKFIEREELIEFIEEYENYLEETLKIQKLYTKKRTVFGESVEVKLEVGHVIGNVAKRIKIIRNALVHSSDRYERNQRYIPNTNSEKTIEREIPLIKYIAEKVIIASAQ